DHPGSLPVRRRRPGDLYAAGTAAVRDAGRRRLVQGIGRVPGEACLARSARQGAGGGRAVGRSLGRNRPRKSPRARGRRIRPGAPFKPWLLQIVANEARNRRRSAGRREALALRARTDVSGDAAPSPEATLLGAERRSELLEAVNRLPEPGRLAISCRYLLDLSEAETAAALGCRRGTVKAR